MVRSTKSSVTALVSRLFIGINVARQSLARTYFVIAFTYGSLDKKFCDGVSVSVVYRNKRRSPKPCHRAFCHRFYVWFARQKTLWQRYAERSQFGETLGGVSKRQTSGKSAKLGSIVRPSDKGVKGTIRLGKRSAA